MSKLLFILLLVPFSLFAEGNSEVDSLKQLLATAEGVERIDILNTMASILERTDFDRAVELATEAYNLAVQLEDRERQALSLKFIGFGHLSACNYNLAASFFGRSLAIQQELGWESEVLGLYSFLGTAFQNSGDYATAINYLLLAAEIYENYQDSINMAMVYSNIGSVYQNLKEYRPAVEYGLRSYQLVSTLGHLYGISLVAIQLGVSYNKLGDYLRASDYYHIAIKNLSEMGDLQTLASAYGGLSDVLAAQENYTVALEYLELNSSHKCNFINRKVI